MLRQGWFASLDELMRVALLEYLRRTKLELLERHQLEDIDWARDEKKAVGEE